MRFVDTDKSKCVKFIAILHAFVSCLSRDLHELNVRKDSRTRVINRQSCFAFQIVADHSMM